MAWTWESGNAEIERLLDLGAKLLADKTKSMEANVGAVKHLGEACKNIWKEILPLRPAPVTKSLLDILTHWKNVGNFTIKAPIPQNPVDINKSRLFGKISFKAIDPMLIFQMREWFIEYYVYKYGDETVKHNYEFEKDYSNYWWMCYLRNSGSHKPTVDEYKSYRRANMEA